MANVKPAMTIAGEIVEVSGGDSAPIIFFDTVPAGQTPQGMIGATLVAVTAAPGAEGGVILQARTVAVLRTTVQGAQSLISSLQNGLLALAPVENPEGKAN
ncbi:hypothetical protein JQ633_00965 [Bradyrhizobium tropiciagri]|uniref:hypothetical protein n=1 Tax=Bradyrhizobium tropiciagri TaxID=312253 RepID=UPI001BA43C12|nr:hypothetical protein [Bradyrhizobium tropiciagri]MBR0868911.1 hypothetical protein [Bradyrhizobium tropiciagri]